MCMDKTVGYVQGRLVVSTGSRDRYRLGHQPVGSHMAVSPHLCSSRSAEAAALGSMYSQAAVSDNTCVIPGSRVVTRASTPTGDMTSGLLDYGRPAIYFGDFHLCEHRAARDASCALCDRIRLKRLNREAEGCQSPSTVVVLWACRPETTIGCGHGTIRS